MKNQSQKKENFWSEPKRTYSLPRSPPRARYKGKKKFIIFIIFITNIIIYFIVTAARGIDIAKRNRKYLSD